MKTPLIENFNNLHKGQTCLLLGNGPSLNDVPIALLNKYIAIGANSVHKSGYTPTYYTAIDKRVHRLFADAINTIYRHIYKFLPSPTLDRWEGENIVRFPHKPGDMWPYIGMHRGIAYVCVMHAQIQLAYWMGFEKMLMVGIDHTSKGAHFWGIDHEQPGEPPLDLWAQGYKELRHRLSIDLVNISTHTQLEERYVPREDWKGYM